MSSDLEFGFVVINVSVVVAGLVSYWWPVRRGWSVARAVAWFWVTLEPVNGVGHSVWSFFQRSYSPGLATSLLLLPLAILLAVSLSKEKISA